MAGPLHPDCRSALSHMCSTKLPDGGFASSRTIGAVCAGFRHYSDTCVDGGRLPIPDGLCEASFAPYRVLSDALVGFCDRAVKDRNASACGGKKEMCDLKWYMHTAVVKTIAALEALAAHKLEGQGVSWKAGDADVDPLAADISDDSHQVALREGYKSIREVVGLAEEGCWLNGADVVLVEDPTLDGINNLSMTLRHVERSIRDECHESMPREGVA